MIFHDRVNKPYPLPESEWLLDPERATESPGGIVRVCAVVIHKDMVVATVAKERTAKLPDLGGGCHPTGGLGVELLKLLQSPVLFFG